MADGTMAQRTFETYATHHGPIIREEGGKWIAISLMNKPVPALEQSFLRTKTRDLAGFLKVAELKANSSNNTLFADDKGHIAYLHPQFVPIRDQRFDWRAPVDGADPRTAWMGLHPLSTLPQVIDPKNGWAYNTNNAPWSAAGADSPQGRLSRLYGRSGRQSARASCRTGSGRHAAFLDRQPDPGGARSVAARV
jgi:acyl-homoserine-lactone acylase